MKNIKVYRSCFQPCLALFWYTPSRIKTLDNCLKLKAKQSSYYPDYCDKLIDQYGVTDVATSSVRPVPAVTNGWGWSAWNEWLDDQCPEDCGRR